MRFGDLTYQEIHSRAQEGWLAIVPTGCTEQQGPHLPVDFGWYSTSGVIGDPTHASVELGARLWKAIIDDVSVIFKDIAEATLS